MSALPEQETLLRDGAPSGIAVRRCRGLFARARGLLGSAELPVDVTLQLVGCNAVHTFGMRYPIDVVFCEPGGRICRIVHGLVPWRWAAVARGGIDTFEFCRGAARLHGLAVGEHLQVVP